MLGIGVGLAFAGASVLDIAHNISDVVLHSLLVALLGATNVGFPSCLALNSIHNGLFTAEVVVGAAFCFLVLAIAVFSSKVLGGYVGIDLGCDITIQYLSKVAELVVGH